MPAQPASFGIVLKRYRGSAGLTQEALAEAAGLSVRGIQDLERGASSAPRAATMESLIQALRLGPDERADLERAARKRHVIDLPSSPFVFVSYAHEDRALAERLLADLRMHGIVGWIDEHDLKPGATPRAHALRDVVRGAQAILLAVTPHSGRSGYVEDEVRIAEMYQCKVFALWMAGENWLECAPAGWEAMSSIDLRGAAWERGRHDLIALLTDEHGPAPSISDNGVIASRPMTPRNPYKGLRAFTREDADDFFGRERLVATLIAHLGKDMGEGPRFLAVVGPSGSGKSSLVLAGMLPALRGGALPGSDQWIYLDPMVPGVHPLEALTLALNTALPGGSLSEIRDELDYSTHGLHRLAGRSARHEGRQVVLIVDQFEELFTLAGDDDERGQFINLLVTAVSEPGGSLVAILTLRADFYDRPMRYPSLVPLLEGQGRLIPPMTQAEIRAAIEQPAARTDVQLRFEENLIGDLLFEVRGEPGALPLLQFTLDQLFARREGHRLTLIAYQELGGVRGALALHAEATYTALPTDEHRRFARALLLRLIDPGATEQDTARRRARLAELELPDSHETLIMRETAGALIAARLLITNEQAGVTTIEVSHEALIREWGRVGRWLREAREDIRFQQAISEDAAEWSYRRQPADHLYRGTVLDDAIAWAARNAPSAMEHAFLQAALAERQRQQAIERTRQDRELGTQRQATGRLRALVGVLVVFLLVAAGLTTLAVRNAATANDAAMSAAQARKTAIGERTLALSRQLAAEALNHLDDAPDLALLLSVASNRISTTVEARDSLLRALEHFPRLITFLHGNQGPVLTVAFSPADDTLISGGQDGTIRRWAVAGHDGRWAPIGLPLRSYTGNVTTMALSHDGRTLAAADSTGTIQFWDLPSGRPAGALPADQPESTTNLAFSPAAPLLAFGGSDGAIHLWDVSHGRPSVHPFTDQISYPRSLVFNPHGTLLAMGASDGAIRLWHIGRAVTLGPLLSGQTGAISVVAFSPDGTLLASGSTDTTIRIWNVETGRLHAVLTGHMDAVTSLAFRPDGMILASGSADKTIRLWNAATGQPIGAPLSGRTQAINSVAFSAAGRTLAAGNGDGTISLWDVAQAPSLGRLLTGHTDRVTGVAFRHDGRVLVSGSADLTLRLWDVGNGKSIGLPLTGHTDGVTSVAYSPVSNLIASGSSDQAVRLWNATSGRAIAVLNGHSALVTSLAFSPDGRVLASGGGQGGTQQFADGTIRLWDVAHQQESGPPLSDGATAVFAVAFSPNGRLLAAGYGDGSIQLWDVARKQPLDLPFAGQTTSVTSVAFSPNGALLASGGTDKTVRLWNVATGLPAIAPLTGHTDSVTSVAFSPNGRLLASGSADRTVRLWDVASGQSIGLPLTGHTDNVTSVAFSPDGTLLASGSADKTVRLWNVDPASWSQRACSEAGRDLTSLEWHQYLGDEPRRSVC